MYGDGKHFEQPMQVTGELILRGTRYAVDCYNLRDRSWGKPRQEIHQPLPPYSWVSAVFSPSFSLNAGMFDQAEHNPELRGRFELPKAGTLSGGWVQRNGKLASLVKAEKRVVRAPEWLWPERVELDMTDELGREIQLRGQMVAANAWPLGGNLNFTICLMRWECDGHVTWGDCQEGMWTDYLHAFGATRNP